MPSRQLSLSSPKMTGKEVIPEKQARPASRGSQAGGAERDPGGAERDTPESAGLRPGSRVSTSGWLGDRTRVTGNFCTASVTVASAFFLDECRSKSR